MSRAESEMRWITVIALVMALLALAFGGPDDEASAGETTPGVTRTARSTAMPCASMTATPGGSAAPHSPSGMVYGTATPSSPPITSSPAMPPSSLPPNASGTRDPALGAPPYFSTELLKAADLAARCSGQPGRGAFNIARISIASVELDGPVSSAVVPPSGVLASAPDRNTAVWYDFSHWPGLGGLPDAGGNIVMAGDAGRIGEGTGIFAKLGRVSPGSFVRLQLTSDGPACYRLEWNKLAAASLDFSSIVQATASESVTLIGRTHRR